MNLNVVSADEIMIRSQFLRSFTAFPFRTLIIFFSLHRTHPQVRPNLSLVYTLYIFRFAVHIIRTRIHMLPRIGGA